MEQHRLPVTAMQGDAGRAHMPPEGATGARSVGAHARTILGPSDRRRSARSAVSDDQWIMEVKGHVTTETMQVAGPRLEQAVDPQAVLGGSDDPRQAMLQDL